jgi:gamma-glutamylcyclotransferase (GGCT)/AIG2-like uncharacterized protein YtfP
VEQLRNKALDTKEVERLLRSVNEKRHGTGAEVTTADDEAWLETLFQPFERLAVYGSLAPGQPNHHLLVPLGGEWIEGYVEGELHAMGWGAAQGSPALRWRSGGAKVHVHVLISSALPETWAQLDAFEGADYRRSLVPVYSAENSGVLLTVANLYECRLLPLQRFLLE